MATTRINLLPWREELRRKREKTFYVMLGGAVLVAAGIWFAGHSYYRGQIEYHEHRNGFLKSQIAELDKRIVKIKSLEETKKRLIARMNVIQELQSGRPQIVHLFHQFVTTLPDGLYLSSLQEKGQDITIAGVAESNARVSNYMENLDASDWLEDPNLSVIQVNERNNTRVSNFTLTVKQVQPKGKDDAGKGGA